MKIIENNRVFAFDGKNEPVAEVMDGETVLFRTHDCFDNQLSEEGTCIGALNWDRINPATGLSMCRMQRQEMSSRWKFWKLLWISRA